MTVLRMSDLDKLALRSLWLWPGLTAANCHLALSGGQQVLLSQPSDLRVYKVICTK